MRAWLERRDATPSVSEPTAPTAALSEMSQPDAVVVPRSSDPDSLWRHMTLSIVTDATSYAEGDVVTVRVEACNTSDDVLTIVSPSGGGNERFDIVADSGASVANSHDGFDYVAAVTYSEIEPGCTGSWSFTWDQLEGPLIRGAGGYEDRTIVAPRGRYRVVHSATTTICRGPNPTYEGGAFPDGACDDRHPDPVSSNEFELR